MKIDAAGMVSEVADLNAVAGDTDPHTLTIDGEGNLFVAATYRPKFWKVSPKGDVIPVEVDGLPAGNVLNLCHAPSGNLFAIFHEHDIDGRGVDSNHCFTLVKIDPKGAVTQIFRTKEGEEGHLDLYGGCMAVGKDDAVYFSNVGRIWKVSKDGDRTALAGGAESGRRDGKGDAARFAFPYGLAIDLDGNLWVADMGNHAIRKVTPKGEVTTIAGTSHAGSKDGDAKDAQFDGPFAVAVDADGNIIVAEYAQREPRVPEHRIRKITPQGVVSTLAVLKTE